MWGFYGDLPYQSGVLQEDKEAVKWYRLAADQGDAGAQTALGVMYGLGQGALQDNVYAHMWWNVASANGQKEGAEYRDRIAKEMTPSQIEKAQQLASQCTRNGYKDC